MRRSVFRILFIAMALAGAGTAAVFFLAGNDAFLRWLARDAVLRATGRELMVEGPMSLELGSTLRLKAESLALTNPAWTPGAEMARVGTLHVSLRLAPLIQRRLEFVSVDFRDCAVRLAENDAGESNWAIGHADDDPAAAAASWAVELQRIRLDDCDFVHDSPARQAPYEIGFRRAVLELGAGGHYTGKADGTTGGHAFRLDTRFGPLAVLRGGGRLDHEIVLTVGGIELSSRGSIADLRGLRGVDLDMRFSGPEFADVTRALAWPPLSSGPFDLNVGLDDRGPTTEIEVDGDLGSLDITAVGVLDRLIRPTTGELEIRLGGPSLEAAGQALDVSGLPGVPYRLEGRARFREGRATLAPLLLSTAGDVLRLEGELGMWPDLGQSALRMRLDSEDPGRFGAMFGRSPAPLPPLEAEAALATDATGFLSVELEARQGESRLDFDGEIGRLRESPQPRGRLRFSSPDVTGLARFFGYEGFPAEPIELAGTFAKDARGLHLTEAGLTVGDNRLTLSGLVSGGRRFAGSRLAGRLAAPDAAAFGRLFGREGLPEEPLDVRFEFEPVGAGAKFHVEGGSASAWKLSLDGAIADLPRLAGAEARFDLRIPSLGLLSLGNSAFALPDLPLAMSGLLSEHGQRTRFDEVRIEVGTTRLRIDGEVDPRDRFAGSWIRVSGSGDAWSEWLERPPPVTLPDAFAVDGVWRLESAGELAQDLRVDVGEFTSRARGRIDFARVPRAFDLTMSASGPDISMLHGSLAPALGTGAFEIGFRATGTTRSFTLEDLDARAGAARVTGNLVLEGAAPRRVSGRLAAEALDLSPWVEDGGAAGDAAAPVSGAGRVFDNTPVARLLRDDLHVDLNIEVGRATLGPTILEDVVVGLGIDADGFRLDPLELHDMFGRPLSGRLRLDAQGAVPHLSVDVEGRGLRAGLLAAAGQPPSTVPPADIELSLRSRGTTLRALAAGLDGRVRLYLGTGRVALAGIERLFADFVTRLFELLNPFATRTPYTELECGVLAADVAGGRVDLYPFVMRTRELTISSHGVVDLGSETLDLEFTTKARSGIGISPGALVSPFVKVGGSLSAPAVELDPANAVISGGAAVATIGLSLLAKSISDRFLGSRDPCGDARRKIDERDAATR